MVISNIQVAREPTLSAWHLPVTCIFILTLIPSVSADIISINYVGSSEIAGTPNELIEGFFFPQQVAQLTTIRSGTTAQIIRALQETKGGFSLLTGFLMIASLLVIYFIFNKDRLKKKQDPPVPITEEDEEELKVTYDAYGIPNVHIRSTKENKDASYWS